MNRTKLQLTLILEAMVHVIGHLIVFSTVVACGVAIHWELIAYGDPKLYDLVPWRFVADTADIGFALALIVFGSISFAALLRGEEGNVDDGRVS